MCRIFKVLFICFFTLSFFNCKSTASLAEKEALKEIVAAKSFTFTANSANPVAFAGVTGIGNLLPPGSNVSNINLANNQNFLTIKNDSIKMDLPFFGEREIISNYGADNSLVFNGVPKKYKVDFNNQKNSYLIKCNLSNRNEVFQLSLILYASKKAHLTVNSSNRSTIRYDGFWKED